MQRVVQRCKSLFYSLDFRTGMRTVIQPLRNSISPCTGRCLVLQQLRHDKI